MQYIQIERIAFALVLFFTASSVSAQSNSTPGGASFAPGRVIVKFKDRQSSLAAQAGTFGTQTFDTTALDVDSAKVLLPEIDSIKDLGKVFETTPSGNASLRAGRESSRLDLVYLIKFDIEQNVAELVELLSQNSQVEYAQPDYLIQAYELPDDAYVDPDQDDEWASGAWQQNFEDLWGLKALRAVEAWNAPGCSGNCRGEGVLVAVIDTGVDYNHPDIWDNIWVNPLVVSDRNNDQSIDLFDVDQNSNGRIDPPEFQPGLFGEGFIGDSDPYDIDGHGTHVAGTIAAIANNGIGIAGVAPSSKIIPIKGLGSNGGFTSVLADALRFATDLGAHVINNSWGCVFSCPSNPLIEDAVRYAHGQNVVVVFAAGNSDSDAQVLSPNFMTEVISVAAVTQLDQKAYFSNWGSVVDIAAPGGGDDGVNVTIPAFSVLSLSSEISATKNENPQLAVGSRYLRLAGTSMAAPHIAGSAAVLLSRHPEYGPEEVKSALRISSDPVFTSEENYLGQGRPNLQKALQLVELPPHAELSTRGEVQGTIDLIGSAGVHPFTSYQIFLRKVGDSIWLQLADSTASVENDVLLADFDTTTVADGEYSLRLIVHAINGGIVETRSPIRVENMAINSPFHNDIVRKGETIEITGEVHGGFQSYRLEFGPGKNPSSWHSLGISHARNGPGSNYRGVLATWDTSGTFPEDPQLGRFYTLRLTVERLNSSQEEFLYLIYLDETLRPGWPQYLQIADELIPQIGAVVTADLDSNGKKEVIFFASGEEETHLAVYSPEGTLLWSRVLEGKAAGHPVAGDLDGDGVIELVLSTNIRSNGSHGRIHVFTPDGDSYASQWEELSLPNAVRGILMLDFDSDGIDELLVRRWEESIFYPITDRISIFNSRAVAEQQFVVTTDAIGSLPMLVAAGQFDRDPELELVLVVDRSKLAVYDLDGTLLPGWPQTISGEFGGPPSVGDIDNDQLDEIVIGLINFGGQTGGLYVFEHDGTIRSGWPVLEDKDFLVASPALGDLDGDGRAEIVAITFDGDREVYVLAADGEVLPNWPKTVISWYDRSPEAVIGDVNSDGQADVLIAAGGFFDPLWQYEALDSVGGIHAWNADGTAIDLNPHSTRENLFTEFNSGTYMALDDIDSDGSLDIVAAHTNSHIIVRGLVRPKERATISVWSPAAVYASQTMQWPAFRQSADRSARYSRHVGDADHDGVPDDLDPDDDNDGLSDEEEQTVFGTNPKAADSDRDGVSDADEIADGSDPLDRGSSVPRLQNKLCSEWNGFFSGRIWNVLEQTDMGEESRSIETSLFDLYGAPKSVERFFLAAGAQLDLLVHDMIGFETQTYGKVCSKYAGTAGNLDGRMVYYLPTLLPDGAISDFQFAFAMPFTNGLRGPQFVSFNTYPPGLAPGDQGNFVANWLQLNNLSDKRQGGTLYFYDQIGELLAVESIEIGAGERRDFSAHAFGRFRVGHAEFFPSDFKAAFQLRNVRYVYDNPGHVSTFDTAFQIEAAIGSGRRLTAPVDTRNGSSAIVELTNTSNSTVRLELALHRSSGQHVTTISLQLAPHASHHEIIDGHLPNGLGAITVQMEAPESIVAVVMQYGRKENGSVNYMYGVRATEALGAVLRGSYNTFLDQQSELWLVNSTEETQEFTLSMRRFDGAVPIAGAVLQVPAKGMSMVQLNDFEQADAYGIATIIPNKGNTIAAWLMRRRFDEYVIATPVRQ